MVVTLEKDGGDTCAHGNAIEYGAFLTGQTDGILVANNDKLQVSPGRFCRHPDTIKWYSNPDTLSRDQLTPLLLNLGLTSGHPRLKSLFFAHMRRGFLFAWNTRMNGAYPGQPTYAWKLPDLTGPEIWACWIRAMDAWYLYPLLCLFDVQTLISSVQRRYFATDNIQMNQVLITDFSTRRLPTPVSLLAREIYGKKVGRGALTTMWGDPMPNNPPVNQYLIPLLEGWKVRE